ncbi:response regulator [Massilia sp. G4R7]|uniref:Response regulator n=1 Tax=Massilia phyllostachyos TaxID=2898585 RepID=A0ABS8QA23_9BURK|nr:response regulator [Massilia phyllostachyos]MCD2518454.1 response regulator [Massilia phyllostachyos]
MTQDAGKQDHLNEEVCSTKDAARLLGVSHRTVQLWVESGQLQAWKTPGGHRRISMSSVERMIARRDPSAGAVQDAAPPLKTVLVVDDDPSMRRLYQLELDGWGLPLRLVLASDGFEALIRIGELRPDLLISDLNMPGMDGFRMIRRLRSDDAGRALSIIVVSGMDRESIAALALPGDIPVFSKPVPFGQLRAAVEAALSKA